MVSFEITCCCNLLFQCSAKYLPQNFSLIFLRLRQLWDHFVTTMRPPCDNFETTLWQLWDQFVTTLRPPCDNFETNLWQLWNNFPLKTSLLPNSWLISQSHKLRQLLETFETNLWQVWANFETIFHWKALLQSNKLRLRGNKRSVAEVKRSSKKVIVNKHQG